MRGHITAVGVLYIVLAGLAVLAGIGIMIWAAAVSTLVASADEYGPEATRILTPEGEEIRVGEETVSVRTPEGEEVHIQTGLVKWLAGAAGVIGGAFIVFAVVCVIGGIGVLGLKPWGRILGIIVGILALPNFPIGTAIGVYGMVILFNAETVALFEGRVPGQVPPQTPPPPPPTAEQ